MATIVMPGPNIVLEFRIVRCKLRMRMTDASGVNGMEKAVVTKTPLGLMLRLCMLKANPLLET
jgi:hypothetical protein